MECPICRTPTEKTFVVRRPEGNWRIGSCRAVHCLAQFIVPESSETLVSYEEPYFASWGLGAVEAPAVARMKRKSAAAWLRVIRRYQPTGRLLDVGCATGLFLEEANACGFDSYGVDVSRWATEIARQKFGADRIRTGTLEAAGFPAHSFDVVAGFDVIEHLAHPVAFLAECERMVKPRGMLALTTPNPTGLFARLMGSRWTHYKREHLVYLPPRAIRSLASRTGFTVREDRMATKWMTFAYLNTQFQAYRQPVLTALVSSLLRLLPPRVRACPFPVFLGERFYLLQKWSPAGKPAAPRAAVRRSRGGTPHRPDRNRDWCVGNPEQ